MPSRFACNLSSGTKITPVVFPASDELVDIFRLRHVNNALFDGPQVAICSVGAAKQLVNQFLTLHKLHLRTRQFDHVAIPKNDRFAAHFCTIDNRRPVAFHMG